MDMAPQAGKEKAVDLRRHIDACTNAVLPGNKQRLLLGGAPVGWVSPEVARLLGAGPGDVAADGPGELADMAARLEAAGVYVSRHELFDVRAESGGPALATIDRGALPVLGIMAEGVHLNGLVRRGGETWLWVARRAADKKLDPGKLDHIVGGGVSAGLTAAQTLLKEAEEEAALPPALVEEARQVATITYVMERPEGLRRDALACYDLWLPPEFVPRPADGEVAGFELLPIATVVDRVRRTDDFKFNINLVLIDLFLRLGVLPPDEAAALQAAMAAVYASGGAASMGISRDSPG